MYRMRVSVCRRATCSAGTMTLEPRRRGHYFSPMRGGPHTGLLARVDRMPEAVCPNAAYPRPHREQGAFMRVCPQMVGSHREAGRGDEQRIEVLAAKGAAR